MSSNKGVRRIISAFTCADKLKLKNDLTEDGVWYYHGNRIAWFEKSSLHFSLCGYDTNTTRMRLNELFRHSPYLVGLHRIKGETYLVVGDKRTPIDCNTDYSITEFV